MVVDATVPGVLAQFEHAVQTSTGVSVGGCAAVQLCGNASGYDGDHVFGFIAKSNYSFAPVQQALRSWANATCLDFDTSLTIPGSASFTTPLIIASNATINGTHSTNTTVKSLGRRGDCTTVVCANAHLLFSISGSSISAPETRSQEDMSRGSSVPRSLAKLMLILM